MRWAVPGSENVPRQAHVWWGSVSAHCTPAASCWSKLCAVQWQVRMLHEAMCCCHPWPWVWARYTAAVGLCGKITVSHTHKYTPMHVGQMCQIRGNITAGSGFKCHCCSLGFKFKYTAKDTVHESHKSHHHCVDHNSPIYAINGQLIVLSL